MDSDAVAHIFVKMSQRKITILDEAGYEEVVKYKWDEDGSEGFSETLANFQATVPRDLLTITP
jgi:predicted CopG family antitoxin